jgi:hypothetical protein
MRDNGSRSELSDGCQDGRRLEQECDVVVRRCSAWFGGITLTVNVVSLILVAVVAVGQWRLYAQDALETKCEFLEAQLSQQRSNLLSQSIAPTRPADEASPSERPHADLARP